jgi:hypothetical protein
MCRNIRTLFNFEPPATEDEIRASALQFVRKLSGFNVPSKANEDVFQCAVDEVTDVARRLLQALQTSRATARSRPRRRAPGPARGSPTAGADRTVVPGAAQHAVMRCRPGTVPNSELNPFCQILPIRI